MKHAIKTGFRILTVCFLFMLLSCGGRGASQAAYYDNVMAAPGIAYSYTTASWEGPGFYPEEAVSVDGSARQAYRNMSSLYGEASQAEAPLSPGPSQYMGADNPVQARKLIKRAELRIRVEDPAATEKPVSDLLQKYGAWPASTGIYENSRTYSIRVPSDSYDAMLAELSGLGRLLRRTENAEDVTLRYYDLESRLATRRELLRTYQSYLGRAGSIDDIMTVESRIADLQREIDETGTRFRNLVSSIDYSTIDLRIEGPASASSYARPTLGEKMAGLFGSFGDVASSVVVVLAGIIIYGVPSVLILVLLFWLLFGRVGLLKKLFFLAAGKK